MGRNVMSKITGLHWYVCMTTQCIKEFMKMLPLKNEAI